MEGRPSWPRWLPLTSTPPLRREREVDDDVERGWPLSYPFATGWAWEVRGPEGLICCGKRRRRARPFWKKKKTAETRKEKGKRFGGDKIYKKYIFAPDNKLEHPK